MRAMKYSRLVEKTSTRTGERLRSYNAPEAAVGGMSAICSCTVRGVDEAYERC
jgi:hypothetical protein